jgi:hypothetical protein
MDSRPPVTFYFFFSKRDLVRERIFKKRERNRSLLEAEEEFCIFVFGLLCSLFFTESLLNEVFKVSTGLWISFFENL